MCLWLQSLDAPTLWHLSTFKGLVLVVVLAMLTFLRNKRNTSSNLGNFMCVFANSIPSSLPFLLCLGDSKIYFVVYLDAFEEPYIIKI